ncbi:hypothetical protein AB0L39_18090 [Streptomyces parvus]|uniref:hypothetical protein n=1 Tax=Streptomyces parvus TaxID=66428 RepID=UPI00341CD281
MSTEPGSTGEPVTGARSLAAVIALLEGLRGLVPLTAGGAATRFGPRVDARGQAP